MGIPAVVSSVGSASISDEAATNMDVCEKPESGSGLPVVTNLDPLQTAVGKESVSPEPTIISIDTEPEVPMLLPRGWTRGTGYSNSRWIRERYKRRRFRGHSAL